MIASFHLNSACCFANGHLRSSRTWSRRIVNSGNEAAEIAFINDLNLELSCTGD